MAVLAGLAPTPPTRGVVPPCKDGVLGSVLQRRNRLYDYGPAVGYPVVPVSSAMSSCPMFLAVIESGRRKTNYAAQVREGTLQSVPYSIHTSPSSDVPQRQWIVATMTHCG